MKKILSVVISIILLSTWLRASQFPEFKVHAIDHVQVGAMAHTALADVDRDGDIDICTKPWLIGDEHVFLENLWNSASSLDSSDMSAVGNSESEDRESLDFEN